jgi:hypothetical protein
MSGGIWSQERGTRKYTDVRIKLRSSEVFVQEKKHGYVSTTSYAQRSIWITSSKLIWREPISSGSIMSDYGLDDRG